MCDIQILDSIPISIFMEHDFEFNININIEGMPVSTSISISIFGEGPFRNQYQYQYSKNVYFEPISISISIFSILKPIFYYIRNFKNPIRSQKISFFGYFMVNISTFHNFDTRSMLYKGHQEMLQYWENSYFGQNFQYSYVVTMTSLIE